MAWCMPPSNIRRSLEARSVDDSEALKVAGVRQTVPIDPFKPPPAFRPLGGIAVIADNTWAAFQGRKKLKIEWDNGPNASYDSEKYKKELQSTARKPGKIVRNQGDAESAFAKGGRVFEADYYVPLLAHASMEPMVATAEFKDGKVTAWAPTQNPQAAQAIIAQELGIEKRDVICNVTLLGGGFGSKSKPDYVAEAAVLSKKVGRPVKRRRIRWRGAVTSPAATRPNERWSMDFVSDCVATGRVIRMLTIVDGCTRECPAIEVDTSLGGLRVRRVLDRIASERGLPEAIVLDNGPEFRSRALGAWSEERGVRLEFIQPGKPVQNAYVESFNGRLRDECLNANWFTSLSDARRKIEAWRQDYNQQRPHSSLDYVPPAEFARTRAEMRA